MPGVTGEQGRKEEEHTGDRPVRGMPRIDDNNKWKTRPDWEAQARAGSCEATRLAILWSFRYPCGFVFSATLEANILAAVLLVKLRRRVWSEA